MHRRRPMHDMLATVCKGFDIRLMGIALAATVATAQSAWAADLKRGALLFQTCGACHSILGDGIGPDISGIYGQKAASRPGFNYSSALKNSGIVWNEAELRAFIKDPQARVRGTAMTFPGYENPADVEDVIAYLKTLK
jgi:cytochrome c